MTQPAKLDRQQLEALWDRHCELEFSVKDADKTVETMVEEPYVNHIPTMTGGAGKAILRDFYRDHFISKLPADTRTQMISRTVGETRLVEEQIMSFTHDIEVDFLAPGVAPTGKFVEIPIVAIVTFEGDKIANEHIYWDQASLLVQLGLLDRGALPVRGVEATQKLRDKAVPFHTFD